MKKELKWQRLIVKFLNKEADQHELDDLDTWLKDSKNVLKFNDYIEIEYLTNTCMKNYNIENAKKRIDKKVKEQESKKRVALYSKYSITASIVFIIGLAVFYFQPSTDEMQLVAQPKVIQSGTNKAILTLENGNEVALEKGKDYELNNISSNGEALVYGATKGVVKDDIKYNYLTIPRGGQFKVKLSDGTMIWLNSDSKLKYPAVFPENTTRIIELVYGEAYLEVSPSSAHSGKSFSVFSEGQEINVLGTQFNIKAYANDEQVVTTLVEGKVLVKKGGVAKILNPNEQSITSESNKGIEVLEIDAQQEISWVNGMFTFNEESLAEIMKILSRWYNINVVFESPELKNYTFTGVLERTDSFLDIIRLIEATSESEVTFDIRGETVIIK